MSGIEEMIAAHRSLSKLDARTAQLGAPLVEEALKGTAAAGTTPDGQAWAPTKKTGGRAMVNAAAAIAVRAFGAVVRVTLSGVEVFWHFGAKGAPRRVVIPDVATMPAPVAAAMKKASDQAFGELTGGAR